MHKDQRPPRIKNLKCEKCGSADIAQSLKLTTLDDGIPSNIYVSAPDERRGSHYSTVFANVCSNCGHLEMRMHPDEAQLVFKKYKKANE